MIKDKVLQMENGKQYYVLESVEYDNKMYALALECDLKKDEINEEDYHVMEISADGPGLNIKRVEDDNVAVVVTGMLLQKARNS